MTTPTDPGEPAPPEPAAAEPPRVRVPIRRGLSVYDSDEYADVARENAQQWDARLWHDRPPR
ncbi:hypothetical protein ACTWP6_17720 [Mycobacterium sp. 4D054]|uniref:hypothetical protein n=1 Tax=Mycobacterium sp. 4D054 TaxID=3457440 RepID=UPI003FD19088